MHESIYNLIPEQYVPPERSPRHRSKYGVIPPSYSTFPAKAGPLGPPKVLPGDDTTGAKLFQGAGATMGHDVGRGINPKNFTKRGSGNPPLPDPRKFVRQEVVKKPVVPKRGEKPVMGLVAEKNFVTANAVDAVVTAPRRTQVSPPRAVDLPSFGKVPKYLGRVRGEVDLEHQALGMARAERNQREKAEREVFVRQMTDEQREDLLNKLKERWDEKHKQYQALPFARDTAMQIARKENLENEMKEIEEALAKLNKKVIFVYEDSSRDIARITRNIATKEATMKATAAQR